MDFFNDHAVAFALVCAGVAVGFGLYFTWWLLQQPAGSERMQEIARAVQEGAAAYLRRQYTTIAAVAVVPFLAIGFYPELGWATAIGFAIGAVALGGGGLHRHERCRPLERPHRRGREAGPPTRVRRRVQGRLGGGPARRRPRPARRRRLLRHPHRVLRQEPGDRDRRPDRARLRRLADLRLRAPRRRHLHEGRRRRRRPRRQDRGGHPRGRPAQPGRDRRQRRRQRRRLRRHGGRPVRDLRGHRGRRDAAGDGVPAREPAALPARARRRLDPRLRDRDLLRPDRQGRLDHQRALQERHRRHGAVGDRLHPGHDGVRRRPLQLLGALRLRAGRPRDHVLARRDHRVLHRLALEPRQVDLEGVADRPRHQHHRGPRRRHARDRRPGDRDRGRDHRRLRDRRPLRDRRRRDGPALDVRPDRRPRRVRPRHRQRRRDRRDGAPGRVRPRDHRSARRRREHDEGGHEGLRDRLGRPRRARPLRRVHARPRRGGAERRASTSATRT